MSLLLIIFISLLILSQLVAFTTDLPFTSLEEFAKNEDYNVITPKDGKDKEALVRLILNMIHAITIFFAMSVVKQLQ